MDDLEYRRCKAIKDLMENPIFNAAVVDVQDDIKEELIKTPLAEKDKRDSLHLEYAVVERLIGRLAIYANRVTMEKKYG